MRFVALLLVVACGGADATDAPDEIDAAGAVVLPREVVSFDAELAVEGIAAVELWEAATGGEFAPELVVGSTPAATWRVKLVESVDCRLEVGAWGCTHYDTHTIEVSRAVPFEMRASTIAHEIGHTLGLKHAPDGLMDIERGRAERLSPCVTSSEAAASGFGGPGACLMVGTGAAAVAVAN